MAVPFTTEKWHVDFIDEKSIYDKKSRCLDDCTDDFFVFYMNTLILDTDYNMQKNS